MWIIFLYAIEMPVLHHFFIQYMTKTERHKIVWHVQEHCGLNLEQVQIFHVYGATILHKTVFEDGH